MLIHFGIFGVLEGGMQHLIVVRPFGPWRVGDVVSDQPTIQEIAVSEHADHVVRINPPEAI